MNSNVIPLREAEDPEDFSATHNAVDEMSKLRDLLLGADSATLLEFQACLADPHKYKQHLSEAITEAIELREAYDGSIGKALTPAMETALSSSVRENPEPIADALYPVMGPAIRRSINETMNQALQNFNRSLEDSFSLRALKWRMDAWRSGNSYAQTVLLNSLEYEVEQVFLIHRETSILLSHQSSDSASVKDADMVSSMLSAIQDFVSDSFTVEDHAALDTLQLGDLTVLIETGPQAVLAVVVRGNNPEQLRMRMSQTLEELHRDFRQSLYEFNGDSSVFAASDSLLQNCLISQTQDAEESADDEPWKPLAVMLSAITVAAVLFLSPYQINQNWSATVDALRGEPGYVVIDSGKQNGERFVYGLRDPQARELEAVVGAKRADQVQWTWVSAPLLEFESTRLPIQHTR